MIVMAQEESEVRGERCLTPLSPSVSPCYLLSPATAVCAMSPRQCSRSPPAVSYPGVCRRPPPLLYEPCGSTAVGMAGVSLPQLKLESEDSSYDSDQELCAAEQLQLPVGGRHEDVSRTVSDTLCAEFDEYVTTAAGAASVGQPEPSDWTTADYTRRVEFACKLGYTEQHVQQALLKLGPSPGQNDFLQELVNVGRADTLRDNTSPTSSPTSAQEKSQTTSTKTSAARQQQQWQDSPSNLRHVVIDGSNVAMSHGNKELFSCRGIRLAVEYFRSRGHQGITVFVPMWRKEAARPETPIADQEVLLELERERVLVFTPSRVVDGKRIACYDDRYILQTALDEDGVVVSNDNYRDLHREKQFKKVVEERILMYSFANDRFMPPEDPLGRNGPTLDNFLRRVPRPSESVCPYGKKCTYGNKCKYYHPERGNQPQKSVTERLAEHAQRSAQNRNASARSLRHKTLSLPPTAAGDSGAVCSTQPPRKRPVTRTRSLAPQALAAAATAAGGTAVGGGNPISCWPQPQYRHQPVCRKSSDPLGSPMAVEETAGDRRQHRPLARQLTLNPSYDPRLTTLQPPPQPHHTGVSRIASAPDSSTAGYLAMPMRHGVTAALAPSVAAAHRLSSSSDPQLHCPTLWPPPAALCSPLAAPPPPRCDVPHFHPHQHPPPPLPPAPPRFPAAPEPIGTVPTSTSSQQRAVDRDELRRRVYWHLSALFPEEKVRLAMNQMPDETDPTKICAMVLRQR